jgi:hypothetical protein
MTAMIVGVVLLLFSLFAVLPGWGLNWWPYVVDFLRGGLPIMTLFAGVVAVLIGIADIRDRIEEKREAAKDSEDTKNAGLKEGEEQ